MMKRSPSVGKHGAIPSPHRSLLHHLLLLAILQQLQTIIRSALEDGVTQTQVASTHNISVSTVRRWVKRYREKGLAGLADAKARSDKGKSRRLPPDAITLIEGLRLTNPSTFDGCHSSEGSLLSP